MSYSIRNVVDAESMLRYCASNLGWNLDLDAFDDIDEILQQEISDFKKKRSQRSKNFVSCVQSWMTSLLAYSL